MPCVWKVALLCAQQDNAMAQEGDKVRVAIYTIIRTEGSETK
jgi:hypothetical protein